MDNFDKFVNQFVQFAGKKGVIFGQQKVEIQQKITPALKIALIAAYENKVVIFSKFYYFKLGIYYIQKVV